jgi:hypothetical protein
MTRSDVIPVRYSGLPNNIKNIYIYRPLGIANVSHKLLPKSRIISEKKSLQCLSIEKINHKKIDTSPSIYRFFYIDKFSSFVASFFKLCGGTLGTAATTGLLYQPRMIGYGDCGEIGGMKNGGGSRSTRRKTCLSATLSTTNPTSLDPGLNPGRCDGKPVTNRLSYGAVTAATTGLLYQPQMIGDYGEIDGMKICRGNRSILRKPAPAQLCPPQIPHD